MPARPLPYTLLSLPRYAEIMGIAPLHFAGAAAGSISPVGVFVVTDQQCNDVWPRFSWQDSDRVSHYDLAMAIKKAEADIAAQAGYWPAPTYIEQEIHMMPRHHRRELLTGGLDFRGFRTGVETRWKKFIAGGQRATTSIGTATVAGGTLVYSDQDSDGLFETATITLTTTVTAACEVKVFFAGYSAAPDWEIRHPRSVTISGGSVTLVFDSWLFIDPDTLSRFPTSNGFNPIDMGAGVSDLVTSVEVYRVYTDTTAQSAQLYWRSDGVTGGIFSLSQNCACGGSGCPQCAMVSQNGCILGWDPGSGLVSPVPATYSSSDGQWNAVAYSIGRQPDAVKIWYQAGDVGQEYLAGYSCDPLSDYWAKAIAWLATARLERPFCGCTNLIALAEDLQRDITRTPAEGDSFFSSPDVLANPFGTRKGEIYAWRQVAQLPQERYLGVAVL